MIRASVARLVRANFVRANLISARAAVTPLVAVAALGLAAAPALAAPCKDAKGKFMKCPPAKPVATRCKMNGKFAKCGTPGAKPV